jgi:ABC-type bacteriocin/lantibiotic exporter with double-glycine peptidase domain
MVLEANGIELAESFLRVLCECKDDGTDYRNVVEAAKYLGFDESDAPKLTLTELREYTELGLHPIIYLDVTRETDSPFSDREYHCVVVVSITGDNSNPRVLVHDPLIEDHPVHLEDFMSKWTGRTILIEKSGEQPVETPVIA